MHQVRVLQVKKCPIVIASETECSEAIARVWIIYFLEHSNGAPYYVTGRPGSPEVPASGATRTSTVADIVETRFLNTLGYKIAIYEALSPTKRFASLTKVKQYPSNYLYIINLY
jgi:hypothetical protein